MDRLRLMGRWQQCHCHCQCKLWAPSASLECRFVPVALVLMAGTVGQKHSACAKLTVGVRAMTERF